MPFLMQSNVDYVGTSRGEEYTGLQPCSYALGVYDKETGALQLAPLGGGRVLRLEPRVHGLQYSAPQSGAKDMAAETRELRLAANKQ